jgi:hypothetical protein
MTKQGGHAGTIFDDEDQRRLRNEVAQEIEDVMAKHDVGGIVFLSSQKSAAWRFVIPKWSGLQIEGSELRLRISTRTSEAHEISNTTVGMALRFFEMSSHCAAMFQAILDQVKDALGATGALLEYEPFPGFEKRSGKKPE